MIQRNETIIIYYDIEETKFNIKVNLKSYTLLKLCLFYSGYPHVGYKFLC